MRNLKRALSLALSSVMLLGMMVVGTGASYADVASKHNVEAIEVAQAVNIMVGDDKGNFNPNAEVTRNEMAVVMANLMKLNTRSFQGSKLNFTDVPEWAVEYVGACYANGIVAGTSATTYGGNDTVTAAQASLMMLKALGYFQFQSDFGDDWQFATVKQANKVEMYYNIDKGVNAALTRNDVAQMVLNALEATMVEPDGSGGTTIKGDGFEVTTGNVKYEEIYKIGKEYNSIEGGSVDKNNSNRFSVELGEYLFKGDLKMVTTGDDFGAPASNWTYKGSDVGTYAKEATVVWTEEVSQKMLYNAVGAEAAKDYAATSPDWTWTYTIDGDEQATLPANFSKTSKDEWGTATGDGVLTSVYVDTVKQTVDVTVINTYAAKVTKVKANDDDNTVTFAYKPAGRSVSGFEKEFDTKGNFKKDDIVLVTVANNEVKTMELAESVKGTVSAVKTDSYVKIDGTKYNYNAGVLAKVEDGTKVNPSYDNKVTLYLDTYGNAIAIDNASSVVEDYLYVKGVDSSYGDISVKALFANGEVKNIDIDQFNGSKATLTNSPTAGQIYAYSEDGKEYDLDNVSAAGFTTVYYDANTIEITKGSATIKGDVSGTTTPKTADNDTVYVDDDNNKLYTGFKNVASIKLGSGAVLLDNNVASIVFITDAANATEDTDSFFFIKKTNSAEIGKGEFEMTDAYVNGEKTELIVTKSVKDKIAAPTGGIGLYSIDTTNSDGYVSGVTKITKVNSAKFGTALANTDGYAKTAGGGVLIVDGAANCVTGIPTTTKNFVYDDDTIFVYVTMKSTSEVDAVTLGSVDDIKEWDGITAATADETAVYVITADDSGKGDPVAELVVVIAAK